ncbi:Plant intracellular Ras-group-related LRR protein 2 [Chionoecetes opilio]|uniref:Plant intracellular Ras-group-related LRR protein 2 n=1 Tax=Chionoecetes opilio TaxID=41210 RepID=A0A8J4YNZ1_CHIOP|nr:Plant intracellular Ras-group-related LRR protein 2 [Chionoecetes opilio]
MPDNFGRLTHLTCCYLNSNSLDSLPDSVGDLKSLKILDVGNNNLTCLPVTLAKLPSLRSLVVVHNKLKCFPAGTLWTNKGHDHPPDLWFGDLIMDMIPKSLSNILKECPVSWCNNTRCQCPIFTFTSIVVVTIAVSPKVNTDVSWMPMLMYFCSDALASAPGYESAGPGSNPGQGKSAASPAPTSSSSLSGLINGYLGKPGEGNCGNPDVTLPLCPRLKGGRHKDIDNVDACRLHIQFKYRGPTSIPPAIGTTIDGASLDVFSRPSVHPDPVRTGLTRAVKRHEMR